MFNQEHYNSFVTVDKTLIRPSWNPVDLYSEDTYQIGS